MAHCLIQQTTTFWGLSAQLLAGGYLSFFDLDTVTPKDVYGEFALTTNNGSTVALDASGRPAVAAWGDGDYFFEVYDSDDVKQGEGEIREPGGAALNIPIPSAGEFVSGDGSQRISGLGPPRAVTSRVGAQVRATARARACAAAAVCRVASTRGC